MKLHKTNINIMSWLSGIILTVILYLPTLVVLTKTPLHDGREIPINPLLLLALITSIVISTIIVIIIRKKLLSKIENT